jgi:hypothetical protein
LHLWHQLFTLILQAQLRSKIVMELQKSQQMMSNNMTSSPKKEIFARVLDSLILEYFSIQGYDFTTAVFLPESGFQASQVLTTRSE